MSEAFNSHGAKQKSAWNKNRNFWKFPSWIERTIDSCGSIHPEMMQFVASILHHTNFHFIINAHYNKWFCAYVISMKESNFVITFPSDFWRPCQLCTNVGRIAYRSVSVYQNIDFADNKTIDNCLRQYIALCMIVVYQWCVKAIINIDYARSSHSCLY